MNYTWNNNRIDTDLANGLGLHMILIWGRVALVQGVPIILQYNSILTIICSAILALYYLYLLFFKYKHIPKVNQGTVLTGFLVGITLLFTIVAWPNNIKYFDPIGNILFYEVLPFVVLGMLSNIENLYDPMVKSSIILLVMCIISSVSIVLNGHTTISQWSIYSMPLSYATLYGVMWLLTDFFREKKIISLVLSIVGITILVVFGSRNTLLSVASFFLVIAIFNRKKNTLIKTMLIVLMVLFLVFWKDIANTINNIVRSYGISSRTINLILNQDYFSDSREGIHNNIFSVLNSHPFGVGIAGDLAQTQEFAHGLYVSILCTYGYGLGALAILALLIILFKAYKKSFGINRDILIIYILCVIPRGFTGGDVWSSDVFWWMLAIALSVIYHRKYVESNATKSVDDGMSNKGISR